VAEFPCANKTLFCVVGGSFRRAIEMGETLFYRRFFPRDWRHAIGNLFRPMLDGLLNNLRDLRHLIDAHERIDFRQ
jgi:hypothetical protein